MSIEKISLYKMLLLLSGATALLCVGLSGMYFFSEKQNPSLGDSAIVHKKVACPKCFVKNARGAGSCFAVLLSS